MPEVQQVLSGEAVQQALARIANEIAQRNCSEAELLIVGIQRGGTHLAHRLARRLEQIWGRTVSVGEVDVGMHRDDLDQRMTQEVHPTSIPGDLNDKSVILVDDVLFSGRTARAALDALTDFGRPKRIQLAVLVDRGHRELPIKADFVGTRLSTAPGDRVNVCFQEETGEDRVVLEKP